MNEFELIARFFTRPTREVQGVGDDCALIAAGDRQIAITSDMLLAGRHFFPDVDPAALGHKALAVNLSDLAAAGASPRCFLLALALPSADAQWLGAFRDGLFRLADEHGCELIGGDTTRTPAQGPLTLCITALGDVPAGQAHTRAGARPGDELWVSGTLGDAALALAQAGGEVRLEETALRQCRARLERPTPRVALGIALRGIASACMDVSDGLIGDAAHIASRSGVVLQIDWDAVPRSAALSLQPAERQMRCALAGGDDYELLFAAPASRHADVLAAAQVAGVTVTAIGRVLAGAPAVHVMDGSGARVGEHLRAFDHFA